VNRTKSSSIKKVMASGNGQVRFSIMSEKSTKHKDVTLTAGDKPSKINVKHKGRTLQFKIENIGGSDFKIIEPQITIEG
jgi:hypothetical protein